MTVQYISIGILGLILVIALFRSVHVGALALAAALGVGLTLGSESVKEVMGGFPVDLMLLLLGVTYLVAIARGNGTLDRLINAAVRHTGNKKFLLPWLMFFIALAIASLGNPLAAMIVTPIAMLLSEQNGRDPVLMGLAAINGSLAGAFAPTSLYGILTVSIGEVAGVTLNPYTQFLFVLAVVVALQLVAQVLFRQHRSTEPDENDQSDTGMSPTPPRTPHPHGSGSDVLTEPRTIRSQTATSNPGKTPMLPVQRMTVLMLIVLVTVVVALPMFDLQVNVGAVALALAVTISVFFPEESRSAISEIDWPTILLVGGIVTYIAVLQRMGAVDTLGESAASIPWPLLSVFALCFVGALISAFASTTALLPVLIPLALPLVATGNVPATGVIIALALSATLVDSTPFSTSGAVMVASSRDEDRPRVTKMLLRWGLSMTIIGPILTCGLLVLPGYF